MILLMFIGDFFSDARAKNMVDTIVDNNLDVEIIDTGGGESIYRNKKITTRSWSCE